MRACTFLSKENVDMIQRPKYLDKLIDKKENGMVKVITGIRRFGKSYLHGNEETVGFVDVLLGLMKIRNVDLYVTSLATTKRCWTICRI